MNTKTIDGQLFKKLLINGCYNLKSDCDNINALNVFPVPDGDTGTNMKMTIEGGVKAAESTNEESIGALSKIVARAMTMSARGNSGVILSQFFKGLSLELAEHDSIDARELCKSFNSGVKQSYAVVKKPTEGTILTVMREAGQKAQEHVDDLNSIEDFFKVYLKEANISLAKTPDLLPCLKEAGVIDSGGQGFIRIVEGMAKALDGDIIDNVEKEINESSSAPIHTSFNADSRLEYGYCTEFILQLMNYKVNVKEFDVNTIVSYLETIGNSIVAFKDEDIIKVHVHTMYPGKVLDHVQQYGEFVTLKIENMSVQHSDLSEKVEPIEKKEHKKYAIVAVSSGEGITQQFKDLGVDVIVSGGQTMNPSTNDFIDAFEKIDADHIIVFPNNSNIIMAATQAAENYDKSDVRVILSKSVAQCYSALTMLDFSSDNIEEICDIFNDEIGNVTSGEVTYSIRDNTINGVEIHKNDYISILDHSLVSDSKTKVGAFKELCAHIEDMQYKEVMAIFYGKDVTEDEKNQVREYLSSSFPNLEYGEIEGKQDVYSFIISVE